MRRPTHQRSRICNRLRLALLIMVAEANHAVWVVEQPSGSTDTLPYHPRLDWLFNHALYATYMKIAEMS